MCEPSGMQRGVEDVLILIEGVHRAFPTRRRPTSRSISRAPPPRRVRRRRRRAGAAGGLAGTDADKLRSQYKAVGDAQKHKFGEGLPGSKPPISRS